MISAMSIIFRRELKNKGHCLEATKYSKSSTFKQLIPIYVRTGVKEVKVNAFKCVNFVSFGSLKNSSGT